MRSFSKAILIILQGIEESYTYHETADFRGRTFWSFLWRNFQLWNHIDFSHFSSIARKRKSIRKQPLCFTKEIPWFFYKTKFLITSLKALVTQQKHQRLIRIRTHWQSIQSENLLGLRPSEWIQQCYKIFPKIRGHKEFLYKSPHRNAKAKL